MIRLTREQVREVDRRAIEEYCIPGIVLMENAARGAAEVALQMLPTPGGPVCIACGGGNNGGDGLAIARHLHNHGLDVRVVLAADPAKLTGDARINFEIVTRMRLPVQRLVSTTEPTVPRTARLIIDALFGTGLSKPINDPIKSFIERQINDSGVPVLAIDLPSGMDCDTGQPIGGVCVRATKTVTFVAEKAGFGNPASEQYTGQVIVAHIGAPPEIVRAVLRI